MLALYFFALIFSSLIWLIYALTYVGDKIKGVAFSTLPISEATMYIGLVILPLFLMWAIFGFINQYLTNKHINRSLFELFRQAKKNMDYSDLIARALIEMEQQVKNGFVLNRFDLMIADLNEIISEIVRGCAIASAEQVERLWHRTQNGGKWAFGKVIIEVHQSQPNFQAKLFDKARGNVVLSGAIMEFCARYLSVIALLEKHDKEKSFLNMLEMGVMGKVFYILAPVSDELRKSRETPSVFQKKQNMEAVAEVATRKMVVDEPRRYEKPIEEEPKESFVAKLGLFKKKETAPKKAEPLLEDEDQDPFSAALERSFGRTVEEPVFSSKEPSFEINEPRFLDDEPKFEIAPNFEEEKKMSDPIIIPPLQEPTPEADLTDTQKTLNDLKKEWEDIKSMGNNETPKKEANPELDSFYPFGGWIDENKYSK